MTPTTTANATATVIPTPAMGAARTAAGPFPLDGCWTALITPFRGDAIDEPALRRLVEAQIAGGVRGLVPCGTTGETVTMTAAETERVIAIVAETAAGRVPIVAGVGGNDTRTTIERGSFSVTRRVRVSVTKPSARSSSRCVPRGKRPRQRPRPSATSPSAISAEASSIGSRKPYR